MTSHRTNIGRIVERTTPRITFSIVDENSVGFKPTTLTLTLYAPDSDQLLGGREAQQNVLDANGVTVGANGEVVWQTTAEDNAIVGSAPADETHVALFEWSWDAGAKRGKHELVMGIVNLARVS
jgi:hypothetical protein